MRAACLRLGLRVVAEARMTSVSASWVGLWKGQVLATELCFDRRDAVLGGGEDKAAGRWR